MFEICGPGVSLGLNDAKEVMVVGVAPGGWAAKSGGLRVNDVIITIDSKPAGKTVQEVAEKLKGKEGSTFQVQLRRGLMGALGQNFNETVRREVIPSEAAAKAKQQAGDKDAPKQEAANWLDFLKHGSVADKKTEPKGSDDILGGMMRAMAGDGAGVGILLAQGNGGTIYIKSIAAGGPVATDKTIKVGDTVLEIGGAKVGNSLDAASAMVKGREGSTVVLKVKRDGILGMGDQYLSVTLTRKKLSATNPQKSAQEERERAARALKERKAREQAAARTPPSKQASTPRQDNEGKATIGDWFGSVASSLSPDPSSKPPASMWGADKMPSQPTSASKPSSASRHGTVNASNPVPGNRNSAQKTLDSPRVIDPAIIWDSLSKMIDAGQALTEAVSDAGKKAAGAVHLFKVGVGITPALRGEKSKEVIVGAVEVDSPAAKSQNIQKGDLLVSVDGVLIESVSQARDCLHGTPGSVCIVCVRRPGFLGFPDNVRLSLQRPGGDVPSAPAPSKSLEKLPSKDHDGGALKVAGDMFGGLFGAVAPSPRPGAGSKT